MNLLKNNLVRSTSWMVGASVVSNFLRFFLIFVLLRLYTQEEFGLWASITSIAAILITGDFGITNVLRNKASKALVNQNKEDFETYFLSSFYFFLLFAVIVSTLLIIISPYIPYENIFKTENETLRQQGRLLFIAVQIIFLFGIPFSLGCSMFFSFNETKYYAIINFIQGISIFVIVVLLALFHVDIGIVSISYFFVNTIIYLFGSLYFMKVRKWHLKKIPVLTIYYSMKEMLPTGIKFLAVQLSSSFVFNALTVYSGAFVGLSVAANVNVVQKIYTFIIGIYQSINNPIWSSLSSNYFSGNYAKCRSILYRSLTLSFLVLCVVIVFTYLFRNFLIHIIAGAQYEASGSLFLLIGFYFLLKVLFDNASLIQNATNNLNLLISGYIILALFVLLLVPKILSSYGINAMLISIEVLFIVFFIVVFFQARRIINYGKN